MTAYTVDADGRPRQRQVEHFNMCTLQANPTGVESDNGTSIVCFFYIHSEICILCLKLLKTNKIMGVSVAP